MRYIIIAAAIRAQHTSAVQRSMARNGYFTLLLTGDISSRTEERLLEIFGKDILKADILKIPHHGSKNSSSGAFLKAVEPKIALASAGINNRYSHPSRETKERLTEFGIPLYCTKDYGETDAEPSFLNHKLFIKSFKKP